jgi:hypothetical protein
VRRWADEATLALRGHDELTGLSCVRGAGASGGTRLLDDGDYSDSVVQAGREVDEGEGKKPRLYLFGGLRCAARNNGTRFPTTDSTHANQPSR